MCEENIFYCFDVSIILYGDLLDPDHITNSLEIEPNRKRRKGEIINSKSGNIKSKIGLWKIMSSELSHDINKHVDNLLNKLKLDTKGCLFLEMIEVIKLDIFIIKNDEFLDRSIELNFSEETLNKLSKYNIKLDITI